MKEHVVQPVSHTINRRQLTIGTALAGAALALPRLGNVAIANQADLASAGYPVLDVAVSAAGYEGIPDTLEAGRYLVNVTVADDVEFAGGVAFLSPYEMSGADFLEIMGGMGGPPPDASPEAEVAEEEGGGEEDPLPAFIYQSTFAGGAAAMAGGTGSAVIDLTPGEWIAWGDDPAASQEPVIFNVTGEFPVTAADPEADITVTFIDFGIMVEGNLTAGEHIFMLENQGAQPHFLDLEMLPAGTTNDDISALLTSDMSATPAPGGINPDTDFVPVAFTATQSIGVRMWTPITLEAGTVGAFCWFPTAGVGDPHAFHGMHTVFEVT